jgi:hypothetical protein
MSTDAPERSPTSMHEQTVNDIATEQGGRWRGNRDVSVTGATPVWVPPTISGSGPWAVPDGAPTEPPTGYEIDSLPDMTTVDGLPPQPPEQPTDDDTFTPTEEE